MKAVDKYIQHQVGKVDPDRFALLVLFLTTLLQLIRHKEVTMSNKNQKPEDNKENPGLDAKANQDQKQPKGKFYSAVSGKTAGYVYSTVGAIAVVASIYFLVTAFSWIAIVGLILSLAVLVIGVKVAGVKMPNLVNKEPQVAVS